jgi:hypothetical protein
MKHSLSLRSRWILAGASTLVLLYAIAGFFVAPGIVRDRLARQIGATLHRPATVGRVRVNPFALSVTVDTLRVADRDGALLLAWDELYVNAEILSLVRRELDLAEVRLVNPYGRMVIRRDGTLNVSDIVDSMKASPGGGPAPVISIDGLHIAGARFDVVDSATARTFQTTIGPWRIDLAAFATRRDNNSRYSFSGRTESGESFAWAGTLAIDPLRSAGEFSLDSVKLYKYGPLYEHSVGFDVTHGIASAKATYELNLAPQGRVMRLTGGELGLGDVLLVERGHQDTAYAVPSLRLTGLNVDAEARRATVGAITASRITVRASRSRDSTINLIRMIGARDSVSTAVERTLRAGTILITLPSAVLTVNSVIHLVDVIFGSTRMYSPAVMACGTIDVSATWTSRVAQTVPDTAARAASQRQSIAVIMPRTRLFMNWFLPV